ncbi:alpha/beta hydrolase fold-domain-containing protein [Gloeopeniophorella convolvens]|nr:alpha/beta hydrolase fold-domain-containing protein [Gloeopeniophorella convolvens]
MAQYAHLSEMHPELAAHLEANPRGPVLIPDDIRATQKGFVELVQPLYAARHKSRLAPDAKFRVQDYKIPVEGGEIAVRVVIPGAGEEEERLAPDHVYPTALNDGYAALKWTRQAVNNVDALSVSLKKGFIVGGGSAGAHLAASLALRARDDPFFRDVPITGQYLACPVVIQAADYHRFPGELLSMEQNKDAPVLSKKFALWFFDLYKARAGDPLASPVLAESHANLAPAFFQICGLDPFRDDGFLYDSVLREAGVKTRVNVSGWLTDLALGSYPGLPHGFASEFGHFKVTEQYDKDVMDGLRWLLAQRRLELVYSSRRVHILPKNQCTISRLR